MGLLKHLLFWPVTGPAAVVEFSLRRIEGVVQGQLTDDERVMEDLMALQMELELGDIDEAEYERREALLIERLRDAREWRKRLGMEEEWAPLEFANRDETGDGSSSGPEGGRAAPSEPDDGEDGPEPWSPGSSNASPPDSCSS